MIERLAFPVSFSNALEPGYAPSGAPLGMWDRSKKYAQLQGIVKEIYNN
jgi:hypothetical protein